MSSDAIDVLEERLRRLEEAITGNANINELGTSKLAEAIDELNNRINIALTGRERIQSLIKRIPEMNSLLDSRIYDDDDHVLDATVKMNIILAEEQCIEDITTQLEKIDEMKSVLDSEHIKHVPNMTEKLTQLKLIQLSQKEEADSISNEVRDLLESYNNTILTTSQLFSKWDTIVTKAEIAAAPKKTVE